MDDGAPLDDLFEQLWTTSFDDYVVALTAVRTRLQGGEHRTLGDTDLLRVLRPFLWWLHSPGFQDVMDTAEDAMLTLMDDDGAHTVFIGGRPVNAMFALSTFLVRYLEDGLFDPTGWPVLPSSAEEAAASLAGSFADEALARGKDDAPLRALAARMKAIQAAKLESHRILGQVGNQRLDELTRYIHDLPEHDQEQVLRALDGFVGDAGVIAFYEAYVEATPDDDLRAVAAGCLETVRG